MKKSKIKNLKLVNYLSVTGLSAGIALLAVPSNAQSIPIPNLFPTGVDSSGTILGDGVADPHYNIIVGTVSSGTVVNQANIPPVWFPNNSNSRWIWETATGQPIKVTRTFRTYFDLTGLDPNTASISGEWAVDDQGLDILINGISTGQTSSGFTNLDTFIINSGFVSGVNTLDFIAFDFGVISGFRVDSISGNADLIGRNARLIAETEPIPEPSSLLFASGLNTLDFIPSDFGVISGFRVDSISGNAELIAETEPIPEPSSLLSLLVVGLLGTVSLKRTPEK
ncbi:MAG: PEP-CTERM sorting domain-containing protein [Okeania sp. SIO2C2]|uniref:PEP-CTERM sorting domain-containing protein n=1 Tax=Okeania sp. SIO2C2 TaxID=2607787 RepID=UPI0013BB451A|nr:PEP-CTERM sorting domain-containing protein [Okeania sp. SIO2C2]NEP88934.1 PEP-CTERM sorting domain-containing protein [Okeania sp. SIO2C2]